MQRYHLSGWMLAQAVTAYSAASAENAVMGALDLVALATLSRAVIEVTGPERFPDQASAVLAVHRELEAEAWTLAGDFLTPTQQADLRRVLLDWRAQHLDVEMAPFVRFGEFVSVMPSTTAQQGHGHAHQPDGPRRPRSDGRARSCRPPGGTVAAARRAGHLLRAARADHRRPAARPLAEPHRRSDPDTRKLLAQTASMSTSAERFAAVAEALPTSSRRSAKR